MEMKKAGTTTGASTEAERHQAHLRALLEELDKCERAGKEERVAAIKAELGEVAKEAKTPQKRAERRPMERPYTQR